MFFVAAAPGMPAQGVSYAGPGGDGEREFLLFLSEESADENNLYTLYATNRVSTRKIKNSAGYSIFPSGKLEIGFLVFSVGHEGMSWNELG